MAFRIWQYYRLMPNWSRIMSINASHRSHKKHLVSKYCGWPRKLPILFTDIRRKLIDRFCIRRSQHLFGSIAVNKPATIEDKSLSQFICGYQEPTSIVCLLHIQNHVWLYTYRHGRRLFSLEYSKAGFRGSGQTSGRDKGQTRHPCIRERGINYLAATDALDPKFGAARHFVPTSR